MLFRVADAHEGHSPQYSARVCCGQRAGWIKMPLGTEVDIGPGDSVLDEDRGLQRLKGGTAALHFSAHILWPNGWMDQDGSWYGGK